MNRPRGLTPMVGTERNSYLHAVPMPEGGWGLVTSDQSDAVTINARIIAEKMNEDNAKALAKCWNGPAGKDIKP